MVNYWLAWVLYGFVPTSSRHGQSLVVQGPLPAFLASCTRSPPSENQGPWNWTGISWDLMGFHGGTGFSCSMGTMGISYSNGMRSTGSLSACAAKFVRALLVILVFVAFVMLLCQTAKRCPGSCPARKTQRCFLVGGGFKEQI